MKKFLKMLKQAVIFENPTFVSFLAMCPTLAITHSLETALGMGFSVIFVLFFSNILVSSVRNIIPSEIRIPVFISIIATLVTVVEMLLHAFIPTLFDSLGVYLALIVVNCIILGRAESFASVNNIKDSALDGLTMGIAFTCSLALIATTRELIATGRIGLFDIAFIDQRFMPSIFVKGPGAFFTLGIMAWIFNELMKSYKKKKGVK